MRSEKQEKSCIRNFALYQLGSMYSNLRHVGNEAKSPDEIDAVKEIEQRIKFLIESIRRHVV